MITLLCMYVQSAGASAAVGLATEALKTSEAGEECQQSHSIQYPLLHPPVVVPNTNLTYIPLFSS